MANITDQFVTSFSELYYSTTPISGAIDESTIRSWFAATGTAQTSTVTIAGTVATGDTFTAIVGGTTFLENGASTTVGARATALAALIDADSRFGATAVAGVITIVGAAGTGTFTVTVSSTGTGTIATEVTVTFVGSTNLIPLVMEIGTLSNEATVIDTPTFGETYRGKLRGQLDGGQLDAQLYWAPRNEFHQELRTLAETGTPVYVGIKWNSDSTATNSEFVYFDSFVSSFGIDTTFDDVAKVSMTLVVDGAEHFASDDV